ncbi:MAG TPA: hypothetical protein VLH77_04315, partial [Gammaproteobacteria bacterium]|nr:hypothetical protein [Gammaproteobacteria bacterium]
SKKTTGWTEKTKNFFHPGCIITALRLDYSGYSPNNLVGITELACHILEGNRAACQPYISHKGAIMGFAFDVIPRVKMIQGELRKMFPELAEFADSLGKRDLKKIFRSSKSIDDLQAEIETKFGKTVEVSFRYCDEVQVKNEILNQQVSQLNLWVKKGVSVGVIVPEEKVAPEFNPTPTPGMGKKL